MSLTIDWGRSINPAFLVETPSISPTIQALLHKNLPVLNAFSSTRSLLSYGLLALHLKDLGQEMTDLTFMGKEWDEVRPQIYKTATAVCHLAASLWFPYLYLISTESYELMMRLGQIDLSKGALQSAQSMGGILLQCLYFISILGQAPSWQSILEKIPLGEEKTQLTPETEKWVLQHTPTFFSTQNALDKIGILPLLFRNIQELIKNEHYLVIGSRLLQAYQQYSKAQNGTSQHFNFIFLLPFIKNDFFDELGSLTELVLPKLATTLSLLTLMFQISTFTKSSYLEGATGDRVEMDDVVGCDKAKKSILMALDQIKNSSKYNNLGPSKTLKGILFYGPPGTGKSMLAKAFATAADNAYFLEQQGSSFVAIYVGQGAKNVRTLFSRASSLAKEDPNRLVVVFIDEINAIGAVRDVSSSKAADRESASTTEAFLVEMDKTPNNVIVIGATNTNPQNLDKAFTRAGRFDEHIEFKLPTEKERAAILSKLSAAYKIDPKIKESFWNECAEKTKDWCYADFTNLFIQACRLAGYKGHPQISEKIFEEALDMLKQQKGQSGSDLSMYA